MISNVSAGAPGNLAAGIVIKPQVRGFICLSSHPLGCQENVLEQINYVRRQGVIRHAPRRVLVIGASTGYGLATRIVAAFAGSAASIGVFFEKPGECGRAGTPGWYNSAAFKKAAESEGLCAVNINGDAFSEEVKEKTFQALKEQLGQVDLVVYSLAAPRRKHPATGRVHSAVLKPIGRAYTVKTLDTDREIVKEVTIEPAGIEEILDTEAVMGGEDWEMWISRLADGGLLSGGAITVAYSYIGPEVTWPVYRDGTIGMAKLDIERAAERINNRLAPLGGRACVSVNQAVITQASAAIPAVPLYMSLLVKVLREKNLLEGCIEQIYSLFADRLYSGKDPWLDEFGRIRMDSNEMRADVQNAVKELWTQVTTENLKSISDFRQYKKEFLKLFGFGLPGIDYEKEVDPACL